MRGYELSDDAEEDLYRIYSYGVENFGVDKATEYFHSMHNVFVKITKNPFLYQVTVGDYHRCVMGPYSIYYRIGGDNVEIIRILSRQNIDKNLP